MTFDEFKEKVNRRFGRKLSDREIAEVAIESLNNSVKHEMELNEEIEDLDQQVSELKAAMPRANAMTGIEGTVAERVCEILSLDCEWSEIVVMKNSDGIFMDFKVEGHQLESFNRCPNEGEEDE